ALPAPWKPEELGFPSPCQRGSAFLLGPSHFLPRHLSEAKLESKVLGPHIRQVQGVDSMALEALPIFHSSTLQILEEAHSAYNHTVFLVPNWYFGNRYVDRLGSDELFLDLPLEAYNVVRENVNAEHNEVMVSHGLSCLEYLAVHLPRLKFIFWCIARRTLIPNRTSTVPLEGQYLQVTSRFRDNTLDVLQYSDLDTFTRRHMK
ncbi:ccnl1, partial [Symbiodinium pilosum]